MPYRATKSIAMNSKGTCMSSVENRLAVTRPRLAAFAVLAACVPAAGKAAAPQPSDPERWEGVTVKRYLMGRVKPTIASRGAAHLWTNTGFSNRRLVYPVIAHKKYVRTTKE